MQLLNLLIFVVGLPIASSICAYLYRRKVQRLPENQRLALQQFAELAVQAVEQEHKKMLSGDAKRSLATEKIAELYKAHPQLKEPTRAAMEIALEASVYWLKSAAKDG
jgi:LL-H family phage holin